MRFRRVNTELYRAAGLVGSCRHPVLSVARRQAGRRIQCSSSHQGGRAKKSFTRTFRRRERERHQPPRLRRGRRGRAGRGRAAPAKRLRGSRRRPGPLGPEADVVVVSTGCAGLTAAIRARDLGASVLVIEAGIDIGGKMLPQRLVVSLGAGNPVQRHDFKRGRDAEGRIRVEADRDPAELDDDVELLPPISPTRRSSTAMATAPTAATSATSSAPGPRTAPRRGAPRALRHQPRAHGQLRRGEHHQPRDQHADGPPAGVALRAVPAVPGGLALVHERGARTEGEALVSGAGGRARAGRPDPAAAGGGAARRLAARRLRASAWRCRARSSWARRRTGVLAMGERVSGAPFTEEDRDFAHTLGRQACAALETVHLHRMRLEKQRQDKELQIAREIQRACSRGTARHRRLRGRGAQPACYQVGGDYYDFIPLPGGRWALDHRRRLRQGHARQHPHGLGARLAARAGRHRAAPRW